MKESTEHAFYVAVVIGILCLIAGAWWGIYWLTALPLFSPVARSAFRWLFGGILAFSVVALLFHFAKAYGEAAESERTEAAADIAARKPLREQILEWCSLVEEEYAWILEASWEKQQEWAVREFSEVVEDWRKETARFTAMRRNEDIDLAFKEVGEPAARLLTIWKARRKLYQWARVNVTQVELEESDLSIDEKIEQTRVKKIEDFNAFKKSRPRGRAEDDEETG